MRDALFDCEMQDAALQPCALRPEASCQLLCWLRACDYSGCGLEIASPGCGVVQLLAAFQRRQGVPAAELLSISIAAAAAGVAVPVPGLAPEFWFWPRAFSRGPWSSHRPFSPRCACPARGKSTALNVRLNPCLAVSAVCSRYHFRLIGVKISAVGRWIQRPNP